MGRTLIIGDVHGCAEELTALLDQFARVHGDEVVFVGDLVNKGPDSAAVVATARALGARAVLGNHEAHFLKRRELPRSELKASQREDLHALTKADWAYLEALPAYLRLPELNALVVHGGLVPGRPLEDHPKELLCNLRSITATGEPSMRVDDGVPWASTWSGPELVVFGHDARRGLQRYPQAFGLDTACVYGGALSAVILPERRILSVQAKRAYVVL